MVLTGEREEPVSLGLFFNPLIMQLIDFVVVMYMQGIYSSLFTFQFKCCYSLI